MKYFEVCVKQLLDTLTDVVQRRGHLLRSQLSSYEASTMQQSIVDPFTNSVVQSWLLESEHNQAHLFDASINSNQLRYSWVNKLPQVQLLVYKMMGA
ncbi:unnamed protein product [Eruca vesicaria subsp. sativa]|uniref:Uncharacterized protein n=1 Tax=Eruca vesicaria subsp. sativa TaxID=29727 RepID=A0ABC8KDS0_ERUVS|nr:unnamed protein product [Eruca vesicaria subsp. sativa]